MTPIAIVFQNKAILALEGETSVLAKAYKNPKDVTYVKRIIITEVGIICDGKLYKPGDIARIEYKEN